MDSAPTSPEGEHVAPRGVSRRALLGRLALGGVGAALASTAAAAPAVAVGRATDPSSTGDGQVPALGDVVEPFRGPHQAGIATSMQATATFVALDLRDDVDRDALIRMMVLLTDDIERLSQGRAALADPQPELANVPARLTVTVGYGYGALVAAGLEDQGPAADASAH